MDDTTESHHYEFTIDDHETRAEVRLNQGEWSAYAFVNPVIDGRTDGDSGREALPKLLRALADELERTDVVERGEEPVVRPKRSRKAKSA
jgi:hypothetical protein